MFIPWFSSNHIIGHINVLSHICVSPTCICWCLSACCWLLCKSHYFVIVVGSSVTHSQKFIDAAGSDSRKGENSPLLPEPFGVVFELYTFFCTKLCWIICWLPNDGLPSGSFPEENKILLFSSSQWLSETWMGAGKFHFIWSHVLMQEWNDTLAGTLALGWLRKQILQ